MTQSIETRPDSGGVQTAPADDLATTDSPGSTVLDAVILGTGVAGLYQLHQLRQRGFKVRAYDEARDVGGTWFWNRYPGARFDSESYIYQYFFSEAIYKNWSWSQKYPAQPEVESWLQYVADQLDLRKDIQLSTRILSAQYDEARGRWTIRTDRNESIDCQFFITCAGMLSAPMSNLFPGQEDFNGQIFHTSRWPEGVADFTGKRVGVVGIGATGIQVIQTIANQVEHLTVFARTPQYVLPMSNPSYGPAEQEWYKGRFDELRKTVPYTFTGFEYDFEHVWAECTPQQRIEILEDIYRDGSLKLWLASFGEMFSDSEVSDQISEFVRNKMRERLQDQSLIDILVPTDYGFGTHRVPLETNYLEVYRRPNVQLVSVRHNPIARITSDGVQLTDGQTFDLDVIILATGFDAGSGALSRIDIRGRDGRSLAEEWRREIRSTMGLGVHGFPNLLTTAIPLAPSAALCNMTTCLQQQTEWITEVVTRMREASQTVIEPTLEGEDAWIAHHEEIANATLVVKTPSWYLGSNVPGKPKRLLSYIGGVGQYRNKCDEEAAAGYPSFSRR